MASPKSLSPQKLLPLLAVTLAVSLILFLLAMYLDQPQATAAAAATDTVQSSPEAPTATQIPITPTNTPTPAARPEIPTQTVTPIPDTYHILGVTGHRQVYHLGCEASASVDWANYFKVPIIEYTFQVSLPHSYNPDYGFVGDVNSDWGQVPPYAYGVYAGPVADLLQQYGLPAKAVKGYTLEQVKTELAESKPVIVWVIGNMEGGVPAEYTDSEGRTTVVAAYEHVVILTGYTKDTIRYMTNGRYYDTPTSVFLNSWGVLGNMAVIYDN